MMSDRRAASREPRRSGSASTGFWSGLLRRKLSSAAFYSHGILFTYICWKAIGLTMPSLNAVALESDEISGLNQ